MALNDHWIGMPKSPYAHYTATVSSTSTSVQPPTSLPVISKRTTKSKSKKKRKPTRSSKRRSDSGHSPNYEEEAYRKRNSYPDFEYDYDSYNQYGKPTPKTPYIMRNAASSGNVVYMNPSGSSPSVNAIYAGVPKIATYVVPSSKRYVVHRVKSQAMYVPPVASSNTNNVYASESNTGMRRLDPMDYDDNNGQFLGPQNSFPPRAVMNKIAEPGQSQPCHGPECHKHHKGLVRFYWRRVVYPTEEGRRGRPARFRRPQRFRNRRRLRDRARSPSDQKEVYTSEEEEDDDDEETEDSNDHHSNEDYDGEESENSTNRNVWRPKGYGHDIYEGSNYDNDDKKSIEIKDMLIKRKLKNF
ncbi:uncharacterized protein CEXT_762421 [Caerostris extrusa]|uniref:Uncharacterized protein n=1 Tax=Caerostris extrusa TaxID=172846 RepID=A0AAV4RKL1_CAEEX|nr:uncharacterized protein CEXT_762421 [Caerostris extrusa]